MPPFLGHQCWSSFDDKAPFPGAKAILTAVYMLIYCVVFFFFLETLKESVPNLFALLCSNKT